MAVDHPYRRTCRQFMDGHYTESGRWQYVTHPKYAQSPEQYVRAFLILLKDIQELFDYVEPADGNLLCYSYRIHTLLLRACVEVEANCKAILFENGYTRSGDWNMGDYRKIEKSHLLSGYKVQVPNWHGTHSIRTPFAAWASGGSLPWYQTYNVTKHDRHMRFAEATFDHMLDACCGVLVVLSAQFETVEFTLSDTLISANDPGCGTVSGIGSYFRVTFPNNWPIDLRYNFDWEQLKSEPDPFQTIDYSAIALSS